MKGKGFTLAEVITAAVILLLIVILVVTHFSRRRPPPSPLVCGSHLSGLGKAMLIYANDNDGKYPTADKWCDLLIEHADANEQWFTCPSALYEGNEARCHYAMNPNCEPNSPPEMVLLFETKGGWNQVGGPELLTVENHKGYGYYILFNDVHGRFVSPKRLEGLRWKDEQKQ